MSNLIHAKLRGIVGAMAMTGVRVFALHAGLIREDPPSRLTRKKARGLLRSVPRKRRREGIRRKRWSGPVYGVLVWLGFDAVLAPALGLTERNWPKGRERAVFVADHVLFGLVLSEQQARPEG